MANAGTGPVIHASRRDDPPAENPTDIVSFCPV
jgi:hypothetical protein